MSMEKMEFSEPVRELKFLIREVSFYLGDLPTEIRIKLYKRPNSEHITFDQSHFIKTPRQATPYITSKDYGNNEETTLHRAIRTLTSYYESAVKDGYEPKDEWLIENKHFR